MEEDTAAQLSALDAQHAKELESSWIYTKHTKPAMTQQPSCVQCALYVHSRSPFHRNDTRPGSL
jgi:ribosomal protein S26